MDSDKHYIIVIGLILFILLSCLCSLYARNIYSKKHTQYEQL